MRVETVDLTKSYGKTMALDGVSITAEPGEVLSVLGPSGCGKTTFLKLVAGLLRPDYGRILFDGQDVTNVPPQERKVGFVFQSLALFPNMTVYDNLAFPLDARGLNSAAIASRVGELLELARLTNLKDRYPRELSGGQQQRVAIGRALSNEPDLLLLDEPLASLDVELRLEFISEFKRIRKAEGVTAIYVTHDQSEAFAVSDRVVVMFGGKVSQQGEVYQVYTNPRDAKVARFLGATNTLNGEVVHSNSYVVVRIGDQEINLPKNSGFSVGEKVSIMFRPETTLLQTEQKADHINLEGVLEDTVFEGSRIRSLIRVGESIVEALSNEVMGYQGLRSLGGRKVFASFNADAVFLAKK